MDASPAAWQGEGGSADTEQTDHGVKYLSQPAAPACRLANRSSAG